MIKRRKIVTGLEKERRRGRRNKDVTKKTKSMVALLLLIVLKHVEPSVSVNVNEMKGHHRRVPMKTIMNGRIKITKIVAMLPLIVQKHVQTWISVHANNKNQRANYNE